ncbi:MAG: hypothetical protein HUU46_05410 [Candidatus Hydrogenedentes bacterium]|nr:hypothetical protein [Candidatus Hydrogenedentota bacterium]
MSSDPTKDLKHRRYYAEIFLICFAGLLLEVSYTRVFSFKFFYFFTYLVIGIALLGLGAAGVAVALLPALRRISLDRLLSRASLFGGLCVVAGYAVVARIPINTFDLPNTYSEPLKLALVCGALFSAFFAVGVVVSSLLGRNAGSVNALYFADLTGAAFGCAVAIPLIAAFGPISSIMLSGSALTAAGFRASLREGRMHAAASGLVCVLGLAIGFLPGVAPEIVVDGSKHLRTDNPDAPPPVFSEWGPFFRIDVVDNPDRSAPFKVLLHDALIGSTLQRFDGDFATVSRFETDARRLPFILAPPHAKELIVGAAGGHEILAALYYGAGSITGVEINPVTYSLVRDTFADYTGRLYAYPSVRYVNGEGRSYLTRSTETFDIINFVSPDSYSATNAATSSAFVLSESYLYTVEMLVESMAHLANDGIICMELGEWDYARRPNRTASYVSTAREAFRRIGIDDFEKHVVVVRAPGLLPISVILLKKSSYTPDELDTLGEAVPKLDGATLEFAWGRAANDGPVSRIISMPYEQLASWYASHEYDVGPVFDDAPFFWHFARFRDVLEQMRHNFSISVEEDFEYAAGERVLLFTLALCTLFAFAALLLPFVFVRAAWRKLPRKGMSAIYFSMLGLGFMAIEISLIQKLTLLLGYPTYSLTVTLTSMLTFAGIGSLVSSRFHGSVVRFAAVLLTVVAASVAFYRFGLPRVTDTAIGWPLAVRIGLCTAMLAPLALALGAFMPLGLRAVAALTDHKDEYIAWGWAVNGFFSVIGSTLTTILSMAYGFSFVLYLALCLYVIATLTLVGLSRGVNAVQAT